MYIGSFRRHTYGHSGDVHRVIQEMYIGSFRRHTYGHSGDVHRVIQEMYKAIRTPVGKTTNHSPSETDALFHSSLQLQIKHDVHE